MRVKKLTIFYDGACHLCHREVSHYLKKDKLHYLIPIDIASSEFRASDYGLDEDAVNLHMHAMDEDGQIFVGVDCFMEIWKRLPGYKNFSFIFEQQFLRPGLNVGYDIFAKYIRPRLPKRECASGACASRYS